jgi:large subunit ribosomal protein L10
MRLASLPSKQELLGQLVSVIAGPARGLVTVLSGNTRNLLNVLNAIKDKK